MQQQEAERDALFKERIELKEAYAEHERLENEKVQRTKQVCTLLTYPIEALTYFETQTNDFSEYY